MESDAKSTKRTYEREGITARPLFMLPVDFTWPHKRGLTLLGDAAHLMTPFAGEGVNCAMLDALEISKAITSSFTSQTETQKSKDIQGAEDMFEMMDGKIEVYEKEMWERVHPIQVATERNLEMMMNDINAPTRFVEWMRGMIEAAMAVGEGGQGDEQ